MTELPAALGGSGTLLAFRLESQRHLAQWHLAEGAFRVGGRWSPPGMRVLYAALDPSTAILEVGVHKGLATLDTQPHALLCLELRDPVQVRVVQPDEVPNPNWLRPGTVSAGQQAWGAERLGERPVVVLPSVVSTHAWNVVIDIARAGDAIGLRWQERFALDPRLHPAVQPAIRQAP